MSCNCHIINIPLRHSLGVRAEEVEGIQIIYWNPFLYDVIISWSSPSLVFFIYYFKLWKAPSSKVCEILSVCGRKNKYSTYNYPSADLHYHPQSWLDGWRQDQEKVLKKESTLFILPSIKNITRYTASLLAFKWHPLGPPSISPKAFRGGRGTTNASK